MFDIRDKEHFSALKDGFVSLDEEYGELSSLAVGSTSLFEATGSYSIRFHSPEFSDNADGVLVQMKADIRNTDVYWRWVDWMDARSSFEFSHPDANSLTGYSWNDDFSYLSTDPAETVVNVVGDYVMSASFPFQIHLHDNSPDVFTVPVVFTMPPDSEFVQNLRRRRR